MNKHLIIIIISFISLNIGICGCVKQGENLLLNSGFEEGNNDIPSSWFKAIVPADNLTMLWDDTVFYNGSKSVGIINYHNYINDTCNNWAQEIDELLIGRTIEISGWIKTNNSDDVGMIIQCLDEENNFVRANSTETYNPINGTIDWDFYKSSVFVPLKTKKIIVRLFLCGTGEAWFDDVKLIVK
jgi:hypothetical protein